MSTSYGGITIDGVNGEADSLVFGEVVFAASGASNTVPTYKRAKALSVADGLMPAVAMCVETITTGSTGKFLLIGLATNSDWTAMAVGAISGLCWVSDSTAGAFTQTKPTTSGHVQMLLGHAVGTNASSKTIYFKPSGDWNLVP